jgi:hypothetical protein
MAFMLLVVALTLTIIVVDTIVKTTHDRPTVRVTKRQELGYHLFHSRQIANGTTALPGTFFVVVLGDSVIQQEGIKLVVFPGFDVERRDEVDVRLHGRNGLF